MLVDEALDLVLHSQTEWQKMEDARVSLAQETGTHEEVMAAFDLSFDGCRSLTWSPEVTQSVSSIVLMGLSALMTKYLGRKSQTAILRRLQNCLQMVALESTPGVRLKPCVSSIR